MINSQSIPPIGNEISSILRHDDKRNTYKIALVRAINDLALAYPDAARSGQSVVIPLRLLAERWIAYYWPFVAPNAPIWQDQRQTLASASGNLKADMSFRPALTQLRKVWETELNSTSAADGFYLVSEMQVPHRVITYSPELGKAFKTATSAIVQAIQMPIRYAGPGNTTYSIFPKPRTYKTLATKSPLLASPTEQTESEITAKTPGLAAIPGTQPNELCLVIKPDLWQLFVGLSLWVEALCLHEWALFLAKSQNQNQADYIYSLLIQQPENRQSLNWERSRIDLLLLEGKVFTCPWTRKEFRNQNVNAKTSYDLDHLLPLAVYPTNELWNLVPADPDFNRNVKKAKLPSPDRLALAQPHLETAYRHYTANSDLAKAFCQEATRRFIALIGFNSLPGTPSFPGLVSQATCNFIQQVSNSRNVAQF